MQVEECAQGWLPMGEGGTAGPQQPAEAHQQQPDLPVRRPDAFECTLTCEHGLRHMIRRK